MQSLSQIYPDELTKAAVLSGRPLDVARRIKSLLALAGATTHPAPTPAQCEAGNYKKGKLPWHGLTATIENAAGSVRSGTSGDGAKWSVKLKYPYGYFNRTVGADSDHVDVIFGPSPHSEIVYVIDQTGAGGGFDEHKVVAGAVTENEARQVYLSNYSPGWSGLGAITPMTVTAFKAWLARPDKSGPVSRGKVEEGFSGLSRPRVSKAASLTAIIVSFS